MRTRPALRRTVSLTIVAALAVALTACSGGDGKITIGKASEAPVTTETTGETTEDTTVDTTPPEEATGDVSIPDMGTIPEGLPEDMAKCAELATAMSSMAMSAVGSPIPEETKAQIEQIRADLPDDIAKDLDTLVDAYTKLSEAGGDISKAAEAMSGPEFSAATDRLSAYFQQSCAG